MFWGGSDLFSKMGSKPTDKYSHWKIVIAVGTVMGLHATFELLTGAEFHPIDFIKYSPAIIFYVSSMILGYVGLRYIMLSVSSPICNSSGAVASLLCFIFLGQKLSGLQTMIHHTAVGNQRDIFAPAMADIASVRADIFFSQMKFGMFFVHQYKTYKEGYNLRNYCGNTHTDNTPAKGNNKNQVQNDIKH